MKKVIAIAAIALVGFAAPVEISAKSTASIENSSKKSSSKTTTGQRRLRTGIRTVPANIAFAASKDEWNDVLAHYKNFENALRAQDIKAIKMFLEHGADANNWILTGSEPKYYKYFTPLELLSQANNDNALQIVEMLLQKGADPAKMPSQSEYGELYYSTSYLSAVGSAIVAQNYPFLELCIKYKVDFNKGCCRSDFDCPLDLCYYPNPIGGEPGDTTLNWTLRDANALEILKRGGATQRNPRPWEPYYDE